MKRPTKHLSDVNLRGRIRREPRYGPAVFIEAKFIDGPCAGTTREVPKGATFVRIGGIRYSYAGKENHTPLYAKHPKSRAGQRMLMAIIGKHGRDPRVMAAKMRPIPIQHRGKFYAE